MPQPQAANQANSPAIAIDQDALAIKDLASAVLDRSVRPRTNSIRRLAEAVLAKGEKKRKKAKAKAKKVDKAGGEKKARKLARIPGQ